MRISGSSDRPQRAYTLQGTNGIQERGRIAQVMLQSRWVNRQMGRVQRVMVRRAAEVPGSGNGIGKDRPYAAMDVPRPHLAILRVIHGLALE